MDHTVHQQKHIGPLHISSPNFSSDVEVERTEREIRSEGRLKERERENSRTIEQQREQIKKIKKCSYFIFK